LTILLIPNSYLPKLGGLELAVYNVAHYLARKAHKVTVIAGTSIVKYSKEADSDSVTVYRMPFILPRVVTRCGYKKAMISLLKSIVTPCLIPLTFFKLFQIIRSTKPDIVNLHYIAENAFFCLLVRKFLRFNFIVNIHGEDIEWYNKRSFISRWLTKKTLQNADLVLSNSKYLLKKAEKICPIKNKDVVGNGIDLKHFEDNKKYIHNKRYILSIGNFGYKKGFDVLIKAFNIVSSKYPGVDLLMAGDGLERAKCERLVLEVKLNKSVNFLGKVGRTRIPLLLNGCELFILPSRREPFGIVLLEAMAAGKPIVATRAGGVPEVVKEGENAILVEPESSDALAQGIMKLLQDSDLRKRFGEKGKEIVKNFTWDKVIERYIKIYDVIKR